MYSIYCVSNVQYYCTVLYYSTHYAVSKYLLNVNLFILYIV